MTDKKDVPREAEISTVDCKCDHCGKSLNRITKVWVWNEHFGCSRTCVQRAQGNTNALDSAAAFKQSVITATRVIYGIPRDIDLL
jgi:hypothetical protein